MQHYLPFLHQNCIVAKLLVFFLGELRLHCLEVYFGNKLEDVIHFCDHAIRTMQSEVMHTCNQNHALKLHTVYVVQRLKNIHSLALGIVLLPLWCYDASE